MTIFDWDAQTYDALPLPHVRWGQGVVDQLELTAGTYVLDLGCGTGRDVDLVLDRQSDLTVIGVDGSTSMLAQFRERLADHDQVRAVQADLTRPLTLDQLGLTEPADAAMSVACFHWIPDHGALFRSIAGVLRPGARFVAECGGEGNVTAVTAAIDAVKGVQHDHVWEFESVEETERQLDAAGFVDIEVRKRSDPLILESRAQVEAYLATVVLGAELATMPEPEQRTFVSAVADALGGFTIDYSRLELSATR